MGSGLSGPRAVVACLLLFAALLSAVSVGPAPQRNSSSNVDEADYAMESLRWLESNADGGVGPGGLQVNADPAVRVERSPSGIVCNLQPIHIYLIGNGGEGVATVNYVVTVEADPAIPGFEAPRVLEGSASYPSIVLGLSGDVGLISIPGLPSLDATFTWSSPIGGEVEVTLRVRSQVTVSVSVGGVDVYSESIAVDTCAAELTGSPFTLALSSESLLSGAIVENFGLSQPGWVAYEQDRVAVRVLAVDDKGLRGVELEYNVSGGSPQRVKVEPDDSSKAVSGIVDSVNAFIDSIESEVRQVDPSFSLPRTSAPVIAGIAEIPPTPPGNYVIFRSVAEDVDGNVASSPSGIYYITVGGAVKVLVVDPSLRLWLLRYNAESLSEALRAAAAIDMPDEAASLMKKLEELAARLKELGAPQFRNWQSISDDYEIMIAMPESDFGYILSSFEPDAIILSNMFLGLEDSEYLDWDLRYNEALDDIIGYVKSNNAAIIATHGSLFDWIVWTSCEEKYRVGPRGHSGTSIWDLDVIRERTLAAVLGLPEITLWEVVRDYIAEGLCSLEDPRARAAGQAIGSIPLVVPYVPFSGRIQATEAASELGFNIPETLEVRVPGALEELGFEAYTSVGWQLALPRLVAGEAFEALPQAWREASAFYSRLSTFIAETLKAAGIDRAVLEDALRGALEGDIKLMRQVLASANIKGSTFYTSFTVEELGVVELEVAVPEAAFKRFLPRFPVELVAISDDYLAAIIVHDKYWDPMGYRAVFFTFEPEASEPATAEALLAAAIDWALKWRFLDVFEALGDIIAPREVADEFKRMVGSVEGYLYLEESSVLNEDGFNLLEFRAPSGSTIYVLAAHPTSESIEVRILEGPAEIASVETGLYVTLVEVRVGGEGGRVIIGLQAKSKSSMNPVYAQGYNYVPPETVTVTETTTTTVTTTTTTTVTETTTTTATVTTTTTTTSVTTTTVTTTVTDTITVTTTTTYTETTFNTVTVTETITEVETRTITESITVTVTKPILTTVTVTTTEKTLETLKVTETVTETETLTVSITVTEEKVEAAIVTETKTETVTETVTVETGFDLGLTGLLAAIALIAGLALGYIVRRQG